MASSPEDDFSDLKEIGIDVVEANETLLARKFGKCLKHVQTVVASLDNRTLLRLYGFYKQSVEGPCSIPKPGWYDLKGQSKWQAWKMLGDLDKAQAMEGYIQLTLATCPDFSLDGTSSKAPSWVAVSAPIPEANSSAATISDHIRSGDLDQVAAYLKHNPSNINRLDSNGLGLIHYAADIGDSRILELLLKGGCQVNLQDSEGQTALHYASSCGNLGCVQLLLDYKVDCSVRDSEGSLAVDLAENDRIRHLLE
ncbi:acyl-CoA-binding domain-containing protein 6-like isoform X2 [Dendroctonus ponderosae]|uniref:Acyl-CoA-binding domain-containing protein 6 n=1 Tax=Dendroctonus ponderosae TaxID=77166 RepID=U4V0P5_DENPD|nr:acyl-CoA-binding domain-containing protein 6 isoform X2 [Dendroctonus ponderosae]XP_048525791.1 acyl-CoA-binding domain-containing protein 6-like isoform X2 [Dendroctonus ponderosae]ERL86001.1 hypothetical protein D910_03415 [Dendroctonus ponderosae]ERL96256.1 hypothetical protein D910_01660 [Dendroctonus ponderosae]